MTINRRYRTRGYTDEWTGCLPTSSDDALYALGVGLLGSNAD